MLTAISPFLEHAQPAFQPVLRECFRNTIHHCCVTLDKSLALPELQLPSLPGAFIFLTFQDYAGIQFIQSSYIYQAPPQRSALYQACRRQGLLWKSKACLGLTHRARPEARNQKWSGARTGKMERLMDCEGGPWALWSGRSGAIFSHSCLPLPTSPPPSPTSHPPPSPLHLPCDPVLPWGHRVCARASQASRRGSRMFLPLPLPHNFVT